MAGAKRCLGIDLGSHTVKIAEMAIDKDGLRLVRLVAADVPVGPEAQAEQLHAAQVSTVRNLLKENKISTKKAVFSMPGQTVFVRPSVSVPKVTGPRLNQIVHLEARQLIPFPLDKTMVEYQVFEGEDERMVDVLLVAMKKETNQEFMRTVRRMGVKPEAISISSLALFNGQQIERFDFEKWQRAQASSGGFMGLPIGGKKDAADKKKPDKKSKKKKKKKGKKGDEELPEMEGEAAAMVGDEEALEAEEDLDAGLDFPGEGDEFSAFEEVRAFVNLGARTTDLAIGRGAGMNGVGFIRSIPLGGNRVTQEISKACGCETITQAEQIKREKTACQSTAFEIEADREAYNADACEAATRVIDRINAEIRRSIDFFISQPNGVAVDSIVISGGGALMPYLASYLEERLSMPVELANGLGNPQVKAPSQYSEDFDFSPYQVALGLAAQGLAISPVHVDFLPPDIRSVRDFSGQSFELVALGAMIGGMVFFGSQIGSTSIRSYRSEISQLETVIRSKEPVQKQLQQAEQNTERLFQKLEILEKNLVPGDFWLRFLADVQQVKPPEILITRIQAQPSHENPVQARARIEGEAEDRGAVNRFIRDLKSEENSIVDAGYIDSRDNFQSVHFKKGVVKFWVWTTLRHPEGGLISQLDPPPEPEPDQAGTDATRSGVQSNTRNDNNARRAIGPFVRQRPAGTR